MQVMALKGFSARDAALGAACGIAFGLAFPRFLGMFLGTQHRSVVEESSSSTTHPPASASTAPFATSSASALVSAAVSQPAQSSSDVVKQGGDDVFVPGHELEQLVADCLAAAGADSVQAALVAEVLVAADRRGIPSHGVNRAEFYCAELERQLVDAAATPVVHCEGPSTAVVDGRNALGAVVAEFAVMVAIAKAKATGVGLVCAHHSNHYGIAGYWADRALREHLIGFSFTNTSPFMVPTRGQARAVGTNPIACYCPALDDSFQLDMATTTVPVGKVEVCHRRGQGMPLGWGTDEHGHATEDPARMLEGGGLTPLGGMETTAGYKGYGLGMLVEVLCAVLPGDAAVGPDVGPFSTNRDRPLNFGHCFIVVDPKRFCGEDFEVRLSEYLTRMRGLTPADEAQNVIVPGDPEKLEEHNALLKGVRLNKSVAASVAVLAARLGVERVPATLQQLSTSYVIPHASVQAPTQWA